MVLIVLLVAVFVLVRFVRPVTARERAMLQDLAAGGAAAQAAAAPALKKRWLQVYEWRLACREAAKAHAQQRLESALASQPAGRSPSGDR